MNSSKSGPQKSLNSVCEFCHGGSHVEKLETMLKTLEKEHEGCIKMRTDANHKIH